MHDLWLWCRCQGLISCQRCLQVDNIGLLLCQFPVLLCQHSIDFFTSLQLKLHLFSLDYKETNKKNVPLIPQVYYYIR